MSKCDKIGVYAPCTLEAGHEGTHKNEYEEFVQVDAAKGAELDLESALAWVEAPRDRRLH